MTVLATVAWLVLHHCSPAGAAGITANLETESRLDPRASSRSGLGLAQWAGPRRQRMLARLGLSWSSAEAQLNYLLEELWAMGLGERVCAARDPETAAAAFMLGYERPAHRNTGNRAARSRSIYGEYLRYAQ